MKSILKTMFLSLSLLLAGAIDADAYVTTSTRWYTDADGCQVKEIKETHYTTSLGGFITSARQVLHVFTDCGDGIIRETVIDMDVVNDNNNVAIAFANIASDSQEGLDIGNNTVFQQYWLSNTFGTGINDETNFGTLLCSEVPECSE